MVQIKHAIDIVNIIAAANKSLTHFLNIGVSFSLIEETLANVN